MCRYDELCRSAKLSGTFSSGTWFWGHLATRYGQARRRLHIPDLEWYSQKMAGEIDEKKAREKMCRVSSEAHKAANK
jgi:hypothetical protein